jgi:hypothetical protein
MEEDETIDEASKKFFLLLFIVIAWVVGVSYYRFIFSGNYPIVANAECDPTQKACFVHVCDPELEDNCTGDQVTDTSYFVQISRMAKNIPLCDPNKNGCDAMVCLEGEDDCDEISCDDTTVTEGDTCNDPEAYNASLLQSESDSEESQQE